MNSASILVLLGITVPAVAFGRLLLGRWFNHLSLYSAIWGSILILIQIELIHYNAISGIAWFEILAAWMCLYLGSLTVLLLRKPSLQLPRPEAADWTPRLRQVIWAFSIVSLIGITFQMRAIVKEFGSVASGIFVSANELYHTRVDSPELGFGGVSYVGAFAPGACTLAGMYSARIGKLTITGLIPLILVVLAGVLAMGRSTIILAGIWFISAFIHTPRGSFRIKKWQAVCAVVLALAVLIGGIGLISGTRGLVLNYYSLSPTGERVAGNFSLLPPLLFYYTGPVVGFSDYLTHQDRNHDAFWGMYTFAPIFRITSHLGMNTNVPFYEEIYYTPYEVNVLTYLKNVHSDFGVMGILLFPFVLGGIMTGLTLQLKESFSPIHVVILAHAYTIICMSFAYNTMFLGVWYISLVLDLCACYWLCRVKGVGAVGRVIGHYGRSSE